MLSWLEQHMLPCAYKALLGIDCPACGLQRSCIQLMKGNFTASFSLYPPLPAVLVLFLMLCLHFISKKIVSRKVMGLYAWTVLGVVMINYLLKLILEAGKHDVMAHNL